MSQCPLSDYINIYTTPQRTAFLGRAFTRSATVQNRIGPVEQGRHQGGQLDHAVSRVRRSAPHREGAVARAPCATASRRRLLPIPASPSTRTTVLKPERDRSSCALNAAICVSRPENGRTRPIGQIYGEPVTKSTRTDDGGMGCMLIQARRLRCRPHPGQSPSGCCPDAEVLPADRAARDLLCAVDYLLSRNEVVGQTVGVVGFCMGGSFTSTRGPGGGQDRRLGGFLNGRIDALRLLGTPGARAHSHRRLRRDQPASPGRRARRKDLSGRPHKAGDRQLSRWPRLLERRGPAWNLRRGASEDRVGSGRRLPRCASR